MTQPTERPRADAERTLALIEQHVGELAAANPRTTKPLWDADALRARLRQYDRTPFLTLLQQFVEQGPSDEAIQRMAEKWPEKWVQALVQLGRLAGFTEKTEATINVNVAISQMSDSQLADELRREMAELGIIDADFAELPTADADETAIERSESATMEINRDA